MKITLLTGQTFDIKQALGLDIKVIKSPHAKRLTLRIDAKEHLPVLTLPPRCSKVRAIDFVEQHLTWINDCLHKLPQPCRFQDGDNILLFGQNYTICHSPQSRRGVYTEDAYMYVSGAPEFLHRRVCDYVKKVAQKEFLKKSKALARKIGCSVNSVCIKDTKSRWGSCSTLNNINYNWRIAMAPSYVIDYLIAHEVSHLLHQDHSTSFWACVKKLNPHFEEGRLWLKNHGKELYQYE